MSRHTTWVVYTKELTDILRDRRTIISMVLVPLLFYPLISVGLGTVISSQLQRTRAAKQKILVLPTPIDPLTQSSLARESQLELVPADSVREGLLWRAKSDTALSAELIGRMFSSDPGVIPDSIKRPIYYAAIDAKEIGAVVEVPADLSRRLGTGDSMAIAVYSDELDVKSGTAGNRANNWAEALRDSIVAGRLESAGMNPRLLKPFTIGSVDVAPPAKQAGFFLAQFLPYMLMILMLTGGMYPALDITAGEKERNTLETLLAAPVARWEIAVGKFLTVLTAGFVTMMLATASMTFSMKMGAMRFSAEAGEKLPISISPASVGWIIVLMLPMAVLFSAILVMIAISARSYKEGQSYVTPLLMTVIIPAMVTFVPGIELNWSLALIPIVNLCLALKGVLLGGHPTAMVGVVFLVTVLYASFALFIATRMFQRESVLFRT